MKSSKCTAVFAAFLLCVSCGSETADKERISATTLPSAIDASCQTNNDVETQDAAVETEDVEAMVSKRGVPADISVPSEPATELKTVDIIEGFGEEATEASRVTIQYVGVRQADCEEFDSSWKLGEPVQFPLTQTIEGFGKGIAGMKPGGRRHITIPGDLAYGDATTGSNPAGTLVFVVDLVNAKKSYLPVIDERGAPQPTVDGPLPDQLEMIDDVIGEGAEATATSEVTVHYVGVDQQGEQFDSSWERQIPATFRLDQVIQGWTEGIPGMKEGGRRTLKIPAEMAYGDNPEGGRPAGPLLFVVDLVETIEAS